MKKTDFNFQIKNVHLECYALIYSVIMIFPAFSPPLDTY